MSDKQAIQLAPGLENLQPFEQMSTYHQARIPKEVTKDDILAPEFWAHHAARLRAYDEIRAVSGDGTWIAYLIVTDCSRTWAKVKLREFVTLTGSDVAQTQAANADLQAIMDTHEVKHRGPHKWSIVRKSDRAVIEQGFESKDAADQWLKEHARTLSGAPVAVNGD